MVSAPEEQPPRPETAGGLLERRRHPREFNEPAQCQQGGHRPPLPRTGETAYLQGEETESPRPALLFGVWPEPAGITCTRHEVCCCGKTQGQSVTFLSILVKKVVHFMKILRNETGPATFIGIQSLCWSACFWHAPDLFPLATSCLASSEDSMDKTKMRISVRGQVLGGGNLTLASQGETGIGRKKAITGCRGRQRVPQCY